MAAQIRLIQERKDRKRIIDVFITSSPKDAYLELRKKMPEIVDKKPIVLYDSYFITSKEFVQLAGSMSDLKIPHTPFSLNSLFELVFPMTGCPYEDLFLAVFEEVGKKYRFISTTSLLNKERLFNSLEREVKDLLSLSFPWLQMINFTYYWNDVMLAGEAFMMDEKERILGLRMPTGQEYLTAKNKAYDYLVIGESLPLSVRKAKNKVLLVKNVLDFVVMRAAIARIERTFEREVEKVVAFTTPQHLPSFFIFYSAGSLSIAVEDLLTAVRGLNHPVVFNVVFDFLFSLESVSEAIEKKSVEAILQMNDQTLYKEICEGFSEGISDGIFFPFGGGIDEILWNEKFLGTCVMEEIKRMEKLAYEAK